MWPLPEPTRPVGATGWDPPVLVRLELDHGLDQALDHGLDQALDRPRPGRRVLDPHPRGDRRRG